MLRLVTHFDSDGDNTAQAAKLGGGVLYFIEVSQVNAADSFLQLFDAATGDVTVGTTTPKLSLNIPRGDDTDTGVMSHHFDPPIDFVNAITYACTQTATGDGDPSTGCVVNIGYY